MSKSLDEIAGILFGEGESLDKAGFMSKVAASSLKLADLSDGDFVTKQKYDDHEAKYTKLKSDYDTLKASSEPDKTLIQQLTAERDSYKSKAEEYEGKVIRDKNLDVLKNLKVKEDFQDFLLNEISKNVSDTIDFETAAKKYLKEKPQFAGESNDGDSGLLINNGTKPQKGIFDDLNDFVRGN